ncbi:MAG: 3-hydroxyacyl-CoA dehydrogenase NAD-binding domain-containing protein [Acidobacteriota bacterium]|nr:3-hydroxyacyl-CoA dehydrogenase NAD-binding domain-containing protein [Acidobacteriota bacterium]
MIRSIVVLGAGTMGHGIAYGAAMGGFDTRLYDVSEEVLERSRSLINAIGAKAVELGKLSPNDFESARARLDFVTDLSAALSGVDMVIEAVPERMDLKLSVFQEVERHAPADAVVASNTSALSITEISSALTRAQRVAGMHFFNPVHKMKLVEVVCALETATETMDLIEEVAKQMGKETVRIKESPGFVTSRVNAMIGNEAFYMLQQGIASARDIDKALKLGLNHPMGPFELVDLVGLDTRLSVLNFLHAKLGEKYRPCPLLVEYVQAGRLGKKVGKGVYEY